MRRLLISNVAAVTACASCGEAVSIETPIELSTTSPVTTSRVTTGPRIWVHPHAELAESLAGIVEGVLRYDAENDCFFLERDDLLYPVVWPTGTTAEESGPTVVLPAGTEVRPGTTVTGGGGYLDLTEHFGIPPACTLTSREVAMFNPDEVVNVK